jgi:signal transduction histidine kinase/DNA-binding response OmpR family regulator
MFAGYPRILAAIDTMKQRLLTVAIARETDIVAVRERTRKIAELIGFERQDQTRITTAVSEIVRNAFDYGGGGRIEYWLTGAAAPQALEMAVLDQGPGIADLDAVLDGSYRSATGLGVGIAGARRLMDGFTIESVPAGGTRVVLTKQLPAQGRLLTKAALARVGQELVQSRALDPNEEIRLQNREMLEQLEEVHKHEQELLQLNQELHDTNRGVVALYAELDERADHLRRADELKSRFLSNMSHEFRTPLNSITALSRLLLTQKDGPLNADQQKQVQFVLKAAETLTELVNDLLDIARVEAGKTVVSSTEFHVTDLFGALRGMLRPLLVGDVVALVFEDAQDLDPLVTDEGKVSQVLRNFISNALKFTERGEVRVTAEPGPDEGFITFRVKDTGIGIAACDQEVIWQEFGQVDHPLQSRVKGTGLGLPLSRRLAELLGGKVAVQSALGAGSTFSLTLPRIYPVPTPEPGEPDWTVEPGKTPILVVEDNPADSFAYERALVGTPYQVIVTRSIAQARRAMEQIRPAAILLDIILNGEDTWRFLIETKHDEHPHQAPVIVISSTQDERKARSLGADDYLSKPVEAVSIVQAIDRVLGRHSMRRVLVVDDDEVTRYLVRQLLPRSNFQIIEAATGQDAIGRAAQNPPDVVLVDLNMPVMNGYDFLERWFDRERGPQAPAIVLTAMRVGPEQRRRLGNVADCISKSDLSSETLMTVIEAAIVDAERLQSQRPE